MIKPTEYPCNGCLKKGCKFDKCAMYLEWFKCEWNSIVVPLRKKYKVKVKRR